MNEEQIHTFLAILKRGSFSGAAQELYMSQPAVTHRIKTLEEELGVSLFIRDNARAHLTPAGQVFKKEALTLSHAFHHAHASLKPFLQSNTVRVGFPAAMMLGACRSFFAVMKLSEQNEGLMLHSVLLENAAQNASRLLSGDVDLVFSDIDPAIYTPSQFGKRVLFRCTAYACVHRHHPLAQNKDISFDQLSHELIIRYKDSTHFSTQFAQIMHDIPVPKVTQEFGTVTQALAQLSPQEGVVLTNGKWMDSDDYVYLPLNPTITMRIGVIWLKKRATPALRLLIDQIAHLPPDIWRI